MKEYSNSEKHIAKVQLHPILTTRENESGSVGRVGLFSWQGTEWAQQKLIGSIAFGFRANYINIHYRKSR